MAENGMLSWFEKRRQTMTLNLAQNLILKVISTINDLERAIQTFSEGKNVETMKCIDRLFVLEVEIDDLRRAVFAELTKGTLPSKYREDLMSLVTRLDRLADNIKDAARSVKILVETSAIIPKEIMALIIEMSKTLVKSIGFLKTSIEILGENPTKSVAFTQKVDEMEGLIDEKHLLAKISFIKNSGKVDPSIVLVLKDLVDSIEFASDRCVSTADFIRILAAVEA
jgi:predicted phosphate transport protein (TIGR00153 family)